MCKYVVHVEDICTCTAHTHNSLNHQKNKNYDLISALAPKGNLREGIRWNDLFFFFFFWQTNFFRKEYYLFSVEV